MPGMNGAPDLAVEQAPPQLQNLVAGCNAFLQSLSSSKDALDAQRSATTQGNTPGGDPLVAAMDQAVQAQQQLAEVVQSGAGDVLSDPQADSLESAASAVSLVADELSKGTSISDDSRNALERAGNELKSLLQDATTRATELAQALPPTASDAELADQVVAQSQANAQLQTLQAASQLTEAASTAAGATADTHAPNAPATDNQRTAAEAAASLAQQSQALRDAQDSVEIEARVAERMAREGKG